MTLDSRIGRLPGLAGTWDARFLGFGGPWALRRLMVAPCDKLTLFARLPSRHPDDHLMISAHCLITILAAWHGGIESLIGSPLPDLNSAPSEAGHQVDVGYGINPADPQTRIDLYKAPSPFPTPVLVEFHGGGWAKGDKGNFEEYMQNAGGVGIVEEAYARGFSIVTVRYHLVTESAPPNCDPDGIANYFPTATDPNKDAQRVIQYIRSRAGEWGLDKDRVAGIGISAGGHLALWSSLTADAIDASSPDPTLHESSRLPWVVALDTPTNLTKEWIQCNAAGTPPRPAICNYFGECSDAAILNPAFDRVRAQSSPAFQAIQHRAINQDFALYNVYRGNPAITQSSQYPPVQFPTTKVHHHVFGLLMDEALQRIGNHDVTWSVNLLLGEFEKQQTTLAVTGWLIDRVQAPILAKVQPAHGPITNPSKFSPSLDINLQNAWASDFLSALATSPEENSVELQLIGPSLSTTLAWSDLVLLQGLGLAEIRAQANRIAITFAPFNLGIFGGPVETQLTVQHEGSIEVVRTRWY